jgi:hypothetical protein
MSIGGSVTGGTDLSVLFVHPAGTLAQDNPHFTFDPVTNYLKLGTSADTGIYYLNGVPGLYQVPNVSGSNWFEGNSGNLTTTGYQNFGTGDGSLVSLTSGGGNVAVGASALHSCTTGTNNMAIGYNSLYYCSTGTNNMAVGAGALSQSTIDGYNIAVGTAALSSISGTGGSDQNVGIGYVAGGNVLQSNSSVYLGNQTAGNSTSSTGNVIIGDHAGYGVTGGIARNCLIGFSCVQNFAGGFENTIIGGAFAGYNLTGSCSDNTIIGGWRGPSAAISNVVSLSNGNYQNIGLDYNYQTAHVWSFSYDLAANSGTGVHIYNVEDAYPPTNYERAILDWNTTANVFTIGTQAGGTGTVRPVQLLGIPTKATPVSADQILLQDSASSNTLKWANWSSLPGGGGGGMSIGGAVTGGTAGSVLFIDGSSNLAQDNTNFFWDDTNKYLKLGSMGTQAVVYLNTLPALYQVPSGSGANWFEGNAGNTTLTGYLNFGTGDGCMANMTSGFNNTAVGAKALHWTQQDSNNVAIGYQALANIGYLGNGSGSNTGNVAIGENAIANPLRGSNNIAIGYLSLSQITDGSSGNTVIGGDAGSSLGVGASGAVSANTLIGNNAGHNMRNDSNSNVWIGGYRGVAGGGYGGNYTYTIAFSEGNGTFALFDYGITTFATSATTWSMNYDQRGQAPNLHIYNYQDALASVAAYERAIFDWNINANIFTIGTQAAGAGRSVRLIAIHGFQKAGAPAAADVPSGSFALINDTSGGQTWLCYNAAGTIRKVQLT